MYKNSKPISLPLPVKALQWLPECGEQDELVFDLPCKNNIRKYLKQWIKLSGIGKDICSHTSRRTFGTMMMTVGVDLYTTSKLMGHADVRTTQIYAKIVDNKKIEAVGMVDRMFEQKETNGV